MERFWLSVFARGQLNDISKDISYVKCVGYRSIRGASKNDSYI